LYIQKCVKNVSITSVNLMIKF